MTLGAVSPTIHYGSRAHCIDCRLLLSDCICAQVTPLSSSVQFNFVIPNLEQMKITNTGVFVSKLLTGSKVHTFGSATSPIVYNQLLASDRHNLILFPGGAPVSKFRGQPVNLIVPDSSWQQARRIAHKIKRETRASFVSLTPTALTKFSVRRARVGDHALCTMEAVAAFLDGYGETDNSERIQRAFDLLIAGMLRRRLG